MDFITIHLVVIACILCVYSYFTRTFNYWKKRNVKGPKPIAFFGNIKQSALRRENIGVTFLDMYNAFPKEKVIGIYRMTTPCLLLRDLDVIKHIMIKDFDTFADRGVEFSKENLGVNLFHADGETWRILRNRFTPIFTSGKLKNMLYLLTDRGDKFVDYINELCNGQYAEQEVHSLLQKYTLATISACAFGLDIDTLSSEQMKILHKIDKLIFTTNFVSELDMMYPGILKKLNTSLFPKEVTEFFSELVRTVVELRNGVPSDRKDFMDLILELRQMEVIQGQKREGDQVQKTVELTEGLIAAQAFVFYAAGYETSATTMAFMLYELSKNPDVQDKAIAEIDETLEKHHGQITYETLSNLKYVEKVFDETLRKYPLVDPLQRNAQENYMIPGTDVLVEKGQTVLVSVTGIHYDEKYYPNPEKFDPERFSPNNLKERHSCAYLPFGIGPRNCIGKSNSRIEL